jgi:transcriptional regulator with PAS, ATPase and Fis domain
MVSKGTFRSDLYYRLNVVQITVPPLRDQKEALKSAIEFIIRKYINRYNLGSITIDPEVWDALQAHTWPGNFRELDNALQRALLLCDHDHVTMNDLPPAIHGIETDFSQATGGGFKERVHAFEKEIILQAIKSAGGDRQQAANNLRIGLSTIYRKLESG